MYGEREREREREEREMTLWYVLWLVVKRILFAIGTILRNEYYSVFLAYFIDS
jgi:hypothetical protein